MMDIYRKSRKRTMTMMNGTDRVVITVHNSVGCRSLDGALLVTRGMHCRFKYIQRSYSLSCRQLGNSIVSVACIGCVMDPYNTLPLAESETPRFELLCRSLQHADECMQAFTDAFIESAVWDRGFDWFEVTGQLEKQYDIEMSGD